MNVVDKIRRKFAVRILAAWRKTVESIFEVGDLLNEAKDALDYGAWTGMVEEELKCSLDTAEKYMHLARKEHLRESAIVRILPPSYSTIFELSRLSPEAFGAAVAAGRITRQMTRAEAEAIRHQTTRIEIVHTEGRAAEAETEGQEMPDTDLLEDFGEDGDEEPAEADAPDHAEGNTPDTGGTRYTVTQSTTQPVYQSVRVYQFNRTEAAMDRASEAMEALAQIDCDAADAADIEKQKRVRAAYRLVGGWLKRLKRPSRGRARRSPTGGDGRKDSAPTA